MSPLRFTSLAAVSFVVVTMMARLDRDAQSFRDIVRWENVPAFAIYSLTLFLSLLFVTNVIAKMISNEESERAD